MRLRHRALTVTAWACAALLAVALAAPAGVQPQTVTTTNLRDRTSVEDTTDTIYTQDATVLFSNCVALAGATTNSARQDLRDLAMSLIVGDADGTSVTNDAYAIDATNGTWYATGTIPAGTDPLYWQFVISQTNSSPTNTYYYQKEKLQTESHL